MYQVVYQTYQMIIEPIKGFIERMEWFIELISQCQVVAKFIVAE